MKYFKIFLILLLSSVISFYGCNDNNDAVKQEAKESLEVSSTPPAASPPAATPTLDEPKQNAAGVWHYICNKGCASGGGKGDVCATCGAALAHNTAYHSNDANSTPTTNPIAPSITSPSITPPTPEEPKQNAAGVWHYTCSKGCTGGGGQGDVCTTCGAALAHNTAYHN